MFKSLILNINQKNLQKLFDYNFYKNNNHEYDKLKKHIKIGSNKDVDFALKLLQKLPYYDKYSYSFNPVKVLFEFFTRNQEVRREILQYYFKRIVPVLKLIFHHIPEDVYGAILETLLCFQSLESVSLFIEFVSDINNNIDDYASYEAIKNFADADQKVIDIFFNNSGRLLKYNKFRTVAFVELFSQWAREGKLPYNPVQDHLHIIEEWIKNKNHNYFSYAVSGCAALATIDTEVSKSKRSSES